MSTKVRALLHHHLAYLRASGLSDATIEALGFYSATAAETEAILGWSVGPGLVFPYPCLDGETPFIRVKPDTPPVINGRPAKYLSPKGAPVRAYIPPATREALKDSKKAVIITEGEKKAAKADQEGFPTIGLGGVWAFLQDGKLISDLDKVNWRGHLVSLIFDTDYPPNDGVKEALFRLERELVEGGAAAKVVFLPADGQKVGLDDFIVAHGPGALQELLAKGKGILWWTIEHLAALPLEERPQATRWLIGKLAELPPVERDAVIRAAAKALGTGKRAIQAEMKMTARKEDNDTEGPPPPLARFEGLVDIVDDDGELLYLVKNDGGKLHVEDRVEVEGQPYAPPERGHLPYLVPHLGEVLRAYEEDVDPALFEDLMAYFRAVSILPTDECYVLLAAWTAHSYLVERWEYSPYLCLYAVPERGKTRTGKAIAYAAYRGVHTETLREANLFRWSHDLGATLFLDVRDLWRKAERLGCDDLILQRFEKGAKAARVLYPERGAFADTRYFDIYGPTIIATNEAVHHILDTRCVVINMPEAGRDFPDNVTPEAGLPFRERLVAFRARHLDGPLPDVPKPAPGRLGDILQSLRVIIRLMAPHYESDFMRLVGMLHQGRLEEKAATLEACIIEAVDALAEEVTESRLSTERIMQEANAGRPEKTRVSELRVGHKLTSLGFERCRMPSGKRAIVWDHGKVKLLKEKYGLAPPEKPSRPPGLSKDAEAEQVRVDNLDNHDGLTEGIGQKFSAAPGGGHPDQFDAEFCAICGGEVFIFTPKGEPFCRKHAPELAEVAESW